MAWSTRTAAITDLRVQMQDSTAPQRYTDAELGVGIDQAVEQLSLARPFVFTPSATVPADRIIRLDTLITGAVYRELVGVFNITNEASGTLREALEGWSTFELTSQHKVILPSTVTVGNTVELSIRGGFGFSVPFTSGATSGTADTNIPPEWRDRILSGAEGYVLDLYGARGVGRTNVAPAVQQQTARAAQVKLRDFAQWIAALPFRHAGRQVVEWGLSAVNERESEHRGFD